jgi:hypothetical protein
MLNNVGSNLGIHFWPFSAICRSDRTMPSLLPAPLCRCPRNYRVSANSSDVTRHSPELGIVPENVRSEPPCFDTGLLQSTTGDPGNCKRRQWSKRRTMPYKQRPIVTGRPSPLQVSHDTTPNVVGKWLHSFSFCFPSTDDQSPLSPVDIVQMKPRGFTCPESHTGK